MIEPINVVRKNIRQKSAGSLKTKIPTSTVPIAPTPVHTAYAVPIGSVCAALYKRTILIARHRKNPPIHNVATDPEVSFAFPRHEAKPTSKNPAITSMTQFIKRSLLKNNSTKIG